MDGLGLSVTLQTNGMINSMNGGVFGSRKGRLTRGFGGIEQLCRRKTSPT